MRKYGNGLGNIDWDDLARAAGYSSERKMLEDMYSVKRLSMSEIGERVGYSKWVVLYRLKKHGILRRSWGGWNNLPGQLWRLRHCDQRVVLHGPLREVIKATQVSRVVLFRYRKWMKNNMEWAETYEGKGKVAKKRAERRQTYRIFRERYGWWQGLSQTVTKR